MFKKSSVFILFKQTSTNKAFSWLGVSAWELILGLAYTLDFTIFRLGWKNPKAKSIFETVPKT